MNLFKFKSKQLTEKVKPVIVSSVDDKSSVVTLVKEIIDGDAFLREIVQKHLLFVLFLFGLSLFYVNNRFLYERQLREIASLRNEVVDLRYRSLTISKEVKQAGRRTMVIESLKKCGSNLSEATQPIIIIED